MLVLGADLSLNSSGLVVLDESGTIQTQLLIEPPEGTKGVERLYFNYTQLIDFLDKTQITYCAIESAAFGSKQGHLFDIGEWTGIFKLELFRRGIIFILVAPIQLKKYISGTTKSGKETIILDVYKNYGEEIRQNDLADAYVLSRICKDYYTSVVLKQEIEVKKYQQEVLTALKISHDIPSLLI